jgi:predicted transcriptional regulator
MATRSKTEPHAYSADLSRAAIEEARAQVNAGKTIGYEDVRRWLLSWGTEKELPRPRCK